MLASNWSFGIERDANQIALNDDDPTKWSNPLEIRLPNAPSMRIYCLYGHGKQTERGYVIKSFIFLFCINLTLPFFKQDTGTERDLLKVMMNVELMFRRARLLNVQILHQLVP